MPIQSDFDRNRELIVYTLSGVVEFHDVREVFKEMIDSLSITKNLLLDTRPATFPKPLENEDIDELVEELTHLHDQSREFTEGKSAVIAETDLGFGIMRMFNTFAQLKRLPFDLVPFRTMEDALDYLKEDS